jgi:hypothetical protein
MDTYLYLVGGLVPLAVAAVMCFVRRDLLRLTIMYGLLGGVAALITEPLFIRDYWAPPTILGTAVSFEDFIFGFAITAVPFLLYPVLWRKTFAPSSHKTYLGTRLAFFVIAAVCMVGGCLWLRYNSLLVSCVFLSAFTAVICWLRRDLMRPALLVVGLLTLGAIVSYGLFFNFIFEGWWDRYWLLADTSWGITLFGDVPLTELLWYASWAGFAAVGHPFAYGLVFANHKQAPNAVPKTATQDATPKIKPA